MSRKVSRSCKHRTLEPNSPIRLGHRDSKQIVSTVKTVSAVEMVAPTTSAAAPGASNLRLSLGLGNRLIRPVKEATGCTEFAIHYPNCLSSTRVNGSFPIRALDPQRRGREEEDGENSQDDLEYLGKVLAGSIVGAAVIKYGSIIFPEITRPNITLALIMIFTPVVVAVLLLIKQSRAEG